MVSYTVKQTVVENLNADLDGKQPAGDYPTNASLTESLQSNLLNYTTNRILEIPQDIKLELNNGTLTLKAGSKVYVPNGFEADGTTLKFDEVVISSDLTNTTTANTKIVLTVYSNKLAPFLLSRCFSGGSAPTSPVTGTLWYDTTNNKIKIYANSIWNERNDCLPIALLTANSSQYTSIDQVFNGFGYIGSTVFALPGVKVQIPNGRNEDGTCNNIIAVNNSVKLSTLSSSDNGDKGWYVSSTFTISVTGAWVFNYEKNCYVNSEGSLRYAVKLAVGSVTSGKITSFEPYTVDSVVNSNEFYQLKDKAVTTDTAQTISGVKTFTANTIVNGGTSNGTFTIKNDVTTYGTSAVDLVVATSNKKNQLLVHFQEGNKWAAFFDQDPSTKNITFSMNGCAEVSAPTPAVNANDTQVATTAWVNSKIQLVNELPANPVAGVLYCIPEK